MHDYTLNITFEYELVKFLADNFSELFKGELRRKAS